MIFTADHSQFYQNENVFYPCIQDEDQVLLLDSNTVRIILPAHVNEELNWSEAIAKAQAVVDAGKLILWDLQLGLEEPLFAWTDQTVFLSLTVAIDTFCEQIWPRFQEWTFGVGLYRGEFDLNALQVSEDDSNWIEWLEERQIPQRDVDVLQRGLYCADLFARYLHRLISFFPDTVLPLLFIDLSCCQSRLAPAFLFSRARFEHVHFAFKGSSLVLAPLKWESKGAHVDLKTPASIGICLPQDRFCTEPVLSLLEEVVDRLDEKQVNYRLIAESLMTQEWDGIDELIVIESTISAQGQRGLAGFAATGGQITRLLLSCV